MLASIVRSAQICVSVYVLAAVLYTTNYLVQLSISGAWILPLQYFGRDAGPERTSLANGQLSQGLQYASAHQTLDSSLLSVDFSSNQVLHWRHTSGAGNNTEVLEATLLSKAFSQSLHPTKIIPYYYRASGTFDKDDVTITTLVTSNRFKVLKQLVEGYQGPISATIHIPIPARSPATGLASNHPSVSALRDLSTLYNSSPHFSSYVDVHLALSPFSPSTRSRKNKDASSDGDGEGGRQFNVWRNVARLFARTEFVMMLDVDFAVCTDWRGVVRSALQRLGHGAAVEQSGTKDISDIVVSNEWSGNANESASLEVFKMMQEGTAALVVPAFEYAKPEDGEDQSKFPEDKESLLRLANSPHPTITSFHASWAPGHNSTDYMRYYSIPPGSEEIYKVTQYQSAYEPYVIMSKRVPWCDERFTGYGGNKAACLFEMYLSGVSFYVLSDHFLIHQSHKYEEEARREERKHNRKLYTDFKEETCLRYLYRFHQQGILNTTRGSNVREECKKIKSVVKIALELLEVEL